MFTAGVGVRRDLPAADLRAGIWSQRAAQGIENQDPGAAAMARLSHRGQPARGGPPGGPRLHPPRREDILQCRGHRRRQTAGERGVQEEVVICASPLDHLDCLVAQIWRDSWQSTFWQSEMGRTWLQEILVRFSSPTLTATNTI